jgi:hypothetical protein
LRATLNYGRINMKIQDVYTGMLVKANSEIEGVGLDFVRENDFGVVTRFSNGQAEVEWNNPIYTTTLEWWIDVCEIEPAYRKSEVVGNYIKVLRDDGNDLVVGELHKIMPHPTEEYPVIDEVFSVWYNKLPEVFTQSDLLNLYNGETDFEYILAKDVEKSKPQTKVEPKVKPTKSKLSGITVPIKIALDIEINDKPIIEENDEELIIYAGRHTILYLKEYDSLGMASCNANELESYNKRIGLAIAYRRAMMGDK